MDTQKSDSMPRLTLGATYTVPMRAASTHGEGPASFREEKGAMGVTHFTNIYTKQVKRCLLFQGM